MLHGALLFKLGQFFKQAPTAQRDLLGSGATGREPGIQFAMQTVFFLGTAAKLFALLFLVQLLLAQGLQLLLKLLQCRFLLLLLLPQALDFLATRQHAAFSFTTTAHPQEVPANPVAIAADQALAFAKRHALRQCLGQVLHRLDLAQPGRQVDATCDLFQQAARQR